jgi:hypothetical protein
MVSGMPRTPLHVALGEPGGHLTFALVQRACASHVRERTDLDWKKRLPLTVRGDDREAKRRQQQELAKDIAAMANSGGGMLVYGVDEVRSAGTSAADKVEPVGALNEDTVRDIRRVAGNLIYPPVTGIQGYALAPDDEPEGGVLALLVPDSAEAPHLIHPSNGDDWFAAPYRDGPETSWMVERQLASAYAARERGRDRRDRGLDNFFDAFTKKLPNARDLRWVAAVAVPVVPVDAKLTRGLADRIFRGAFGSPIASSASPWTGFGPANEATDTTTRRGLRSFHRTTSRQIHGVNNSLVRSRLELHQDGSAAMAFTRDGVFPGESKQPSQVATTDIETTARDFFALLWQMREQLQVNGDYAVRLTVHPATQIFRRPDPGLGGQFQPWDGERVYGFVPVDGLVVIEEGLQPALESWMEVVEDTINQAGSTCTDSAADLMTLLWVELATAADTAVSFSVGSR